MTHSLGISIDVKLEKTVSCLYDINCLVRMYDFIRRSDEARNNLFFV